MNPSGRLTYPPRGVFIPTTIIFNRILPPKVLFTWIQLCALAWDGGSVSGFTIQELALITGKSRTMIHRHLTQLSQSSTLQWSSAERGKVNLTFSGWSTPQTQPLKASCIFPASTMHHPGNQSLSQSPSYFPTRILGYLSFEDD